MKRYQWESGRPSQRTPVELMVAVENKLEPGLLGNIIDLLKGRSCVAKVGEGIKFE